MKAFEKEISELRTADPKSLLLLIGLLRGDIHSIHSVEVDEFVRRHEAKLGLVANILRTLLKGKALGFAQFNELLLTLDMNRVSYGFFQFFFVPESRWESGEDFDDRCDVKVNLKQIRDGVIKFRAFALLSFGNFRFAHKRLRGLTLGEIKQSLRPYSDGSDQLQRYFEKRGAKVLDVAQHRISKDDTWLAGYLSSQDLRHDSILALAATARINPTVFKRDSSISDRIESLGTTRDEVQKKANRFTDEEVAMWRDQLKTRVDAIDKLQTKRVRILEKGRKNTDIYLSWDHMDVYVATSMRSPWEFEAVYDLVEKVFKNRALRKLNLRVFDPTQCYSDDRLNKSLIESLMLKRALVTIYNIQEADSLGKDSELAVTLAQTKPVIAYIPRILKESITNYARALRSRSTSFFRSRYYALMADNILEREGCRELLDKVVGSSYKSAINEYTKTLNEYDDVLKMRSSAVDEDAFRKERNQTFIRMSRVLAVLESVFYESRAKTFSQAHPLAIQMGLKSGVANGILVARDASQCARLLHRVLTNRLEFDIKLQVRGSELKNPTRQHYSRNSMVCLTERISNCPYRIVTNDEKITNSFWSFYLT